MSESPGSTTESTDGRAGGQPQCCDGVHRPSRLYQVLAWVGIVAGVVFIVAVVLFSGFFIGRVSGHHGGWHHGYQGGQMGPNGSMDDCPMMRSGGMGPMGPGGMMGPPQNAPPVTPRP